MADTTFDFGILAGETGPLRELKAGDVIFKQGDAGQELFIIGKVEKWKSGKVEKWKSGKVEKWKSGKVEKWKSGKVELRIGNRVLDTLSPGNIFGEMALINSAPRNATAVAITDATLIAVSEKQFMFSISTLALNIMRDISRRLRKRAQETELMNIEAITASIVHEIKQPLTAVAADSSAARIFLGKTPPDLQEVRACLIRIVDGVHRTSDVLDAIRSLFQGTNQSRDQIDLNEIILEILEPMGAELKNHGITTLPQLTTNIPRFYGNRRQLQEVIVNLLRNAIEAMDITTDRNRVLRLKTERRGVDAIVLSVEDSGLGIDPKNLESIFDAFVTTKRHGMGLGLAICRVIVNQHGGQLTASSQRQRRSAISSHAAGRIWCARRSPGVIELVANRTAASSNAAIVEMGI